MNIEEPREVRGSFAGSPKDKLTKPNQKQNMINQIVSNQQQLKLYQNNVVRHNAGGAPATANYG